jgi:transaldolase
MITYNLPENQLEREERMPEGYFKRVSELSPTRFWINNATRDEAILAIDNGAVGCTQNPSYTWKMLIHPQEQSYAKKVLKETMAESNDDNDVVCSTQRKLITEIAKAFLPIYEQSNGMDGYVSIQGDPIHEHDPEIILKEARKNRSLSPNIMIKVPATASGLRAMEELLAENTPINATEVMGVRQAMDVCDIYERVTGKTGKYPISYISHITGIYDEYLGEWVKNNSIDISKDILFQAGLAIARKVYKMMENRRSRLGFIGGGVRGLHHFTEMVGADVCITINWLGTADKLLEKDPPVVCRFDNPVSDYVVDRLLEQVVEFKRGYMENGLSLEEYENFGPVVLFRNSFVTSWNKTLDLIRQLRKEA